MWLGLALALSGPQANQAGAESDHQQSAIVQHSPAGDTLIAPGQPKPCLRKPGGFVSLELIDAATAGSIGKPEPSSLACAIGANAVALSFPGRGGGRAPPVPAVV